ncbi:DUF1302 domain-containing protein, partial [Halopseudomonas sp. Lyrl_26]|uniref:DUF1302 domain-containing protein n=1 Tax=Halopseudomonas sp. Lyrl_26 TaxID=3110923 RepID=UPI003F81C988
GNRNFDKGTVSNRVDILSELDVVYKRRFGFRVSGAGWYDDAYRRLDNDNVASSNHMSDGAPALGLGSTAKRFHRGPSGEILDAFVFGRFDVGSMPLNMRAGRHTVMWGEALLTPFHGVNYGQAPVDVRKALSVPGTRAQELMLPRNAISAQLQATPDLSLAAQYFLDWKPYRLPESGSFLGFVDMMLDGGESLILPFGPGRALRGSDVTPDKRGDWGVSARWSPDWLDGTLGLYHRRTASIQPQMHLDLSTFQYHMVYPGDIKIYGVSLAKNIAGISVGAELSYRKDMPLESDLVVLPGLPSSGNTYGAVGDTWHGVFNLLGSVSRTPLFDAASWLAELQWNRWDNVSQGRDLFKGRSSYTGIDKTTKDFFGLGVQFTPTWYQVYPGVDLTMPLNVSVGLSGNSAVSAGGNEDAGSYSVGIGADVHQKYQFDLKYVDFFGPYRTRDGAVETASGINALLKDRGFVSFTFTTAF